MEARAIANNTLSIRRSKRGIRMKGRRRFHLRIQWPCNPCSGTRRPMMRIAPWRCEGGRVGRFRDVEGVRWRGESRTPCLMTNRSLTAIPLVRKRGSIQGGRKSVSYWNRAATMGVSFRTLINIIQTHPPRAPVDSQRTSPRRVPMSYRLFIERSI